MNIEKNTLIELLPQFLREDSRTLIQFLEHYYEFTNKEGEPSYVINRIIAEHDLDKVFDNAYLDRIKFEIANNTPESPYVQKAYLLKRIIDFYGSKGNSDSVKYFFRVFFGDDVGIYEPWDAVFIPSSGKWVKDTSINLVLFQGRPETLLNKKIIQYKVSGRVLGTAIVKSVTPKVYDNKRFYEVVLRESSIEGTFNTLTNIETVDGTCKGNLVRSLSGIRVLGGGTNYGINDLIYIRNKENISFLAVVERIGVNGEIEKINILDSGRSHGVNYRSDITTADLDDLTNVAISGLVITDGTNFLINDIKVLGMADLVDQTISVYGTYSAGVITPIEKFSYDGSLRLDNFNYNNGDPLPIGPDLMVGGNIWDLSMLDLSFDLLNDTGVYLNDIFVRTVIGANATFELTFGDIVVDSGKYADARGRTSNFSVLQDSFYHQIFAYEVSTTTSMTAWKQSFDDLVHPAGAKVFNNIVSHNNLNLGLSLTTDIGIVQGNYVPENTLAETLKVRSVIGITKDFYFADDYTFVNYVGDPIVYNRLETQGKTSSKVLVDGKTI